jgi:2-polyprenyl-3-methyl-5-hydroxy-6-metoxy-1,4-benzoquinol methylase
MTVADIPIERVREAWSRAAGFPVDKERVYSDHAAAQEFELAKGKTVLEYGCGGGSDTLSYLRRGAMVYFADIVHSNVEVTDLRVTSEGFAQFAMPVALNASATIPLPSSMFDIVSSHGVLHHIVDPLPVLKEFLRLLKPEGKLYVMLYTPSLEERCGTKIAGLVLSQRISKEEAFAWCTDGDGAPYARSYSTEEGVGLLQQAGFRVVSSLVYNSGDFRTFRAVKS